MTEAEMASLAGLIFSQCPPNADYRRVLEIAAEMCEKYYISRDIGDPGNVIRLVTPSEAR